MKVLFLTGAHASGKTALSKHLEELGSAIFDTGPTLRGIWHQRFPKLSWDEFVSEGEIDHGSNFLDDLLVKEILEYIKTQTNIELLVIVGNRSLDGIHFIVKHIQAKMKATPKILYLEAEKEILYTRYVNREGKEISADQFDSLLERDKEIGLETIRTKADWIYKNVGSSKDLRNFATRLFQEIVRTE